MHAATAYLCDRAKRAKGRFRPTSPRYNRLPYTKTTSSRIRYLKSGAKSREFRSYYTYSRNCDHNLYPGQIWRILEQGERIRMCLMEVPVV
jgi:hypothetical protein